MHGSFTTYGYEVVTWLTQDASDRVDPLLILFPRFHIIHVITIFSYIAMFTHFRLANCQMTEYGPGGGKNTHTAFCILSSNAYNELAYVIIWIWLLLVFVVSALNVICILAIALTPPLRVAFVSRGLDKASRVRHAFSSYAFKVPLKYVFNCRN